MTLAWILGIVSVLGVAGTIALVILAPEFLLAAWKVVLSAFNAIISTRPGCAALAIAAGLAIGDIYGDFHGRAIEKAACTAREVAAEEAATKRDKTITVESGADDAARIKRLEEKADADAKRIKEYEDALANRPNAACLLTPDDVTGLRRPAKK